MRRLSYVVPIVLLCSFLAMHPVSTPANAATTYILEATPEDPSAWTNFSVVWTDTSGDEKFQLSELVPGGFSGVTELLTVRFFDQIVAVPEESDASPYTAGNALEWEFTGTTGSATVPPATWTYTRAVVPLPASAFLLGTGLLGLGILGRRRKRN